MRAIALRSPRNPYEQLLICYDYSDPNPERPKSLNPKPHLQSLNPKLYTEALETLNPYRARTGMLHCVSPETLDHDPGSSSRRCCPVRWWPRPGRGRTPPGFGFWASGVKFRVEVFLDWGGVNFLIMMVKEC